MRLLFDAYWWFDGPPSGRNVLKSIVAAWASAFPGDELVLEIPAAAAARADEIHAALPRVELTLRRSRMHAASVAWRIGHGTNYDSVITQNFVAPFSRAHRTVFVHDVMFQEHPQWFSLKERIYLSFIPRLMRFASLILTSSKAEAARIERLNPRLSAEVKSVGLSVPVAFAEVRPEAPELPLEPRKFLLTVGRLNVRKNVENLVVALLQGGIINSDFPLVVVGARDGEVGSQTATQQGGASGAVVMSGHIPDAELKWLYENCALFVFPSLDEGFGLPILEADMANARQVLSDIPAFVEFGPIGMFMDPTSRVDMVAKVASALAQQVSSVSALSDDYSWPKTVARMRAAIVYSLAKEESRSEHAA